METSSGTSSSSSSEHAGGAGSHKRSDVWRQWRSRRLQIVTTRELTPGVVAAVANSGSSSTYNTPAPAPIAVSAVHLEHPGSTYSAPTPTPVRMVDVARGNDSTLAPTTSVSIVDLGHSTSSSNAPVMRADPEHGRISTGETPDDAASGKSSRGCSHTALIATTYSLALLLLTSGLIATVVGFELRPFEPTEPVKVCGFAALAGGIGVLAVLGAALRLMDYRLVRAS